jgi:hypothetical protein
MTTWHIEIKFQAPRRAVIKEGTTDDISDALPSPFISVSHNEFNELEFVVYEKGPDSLTVYTEAYRLSATACTDVLGYPVEFIRAEILDYDHWEKQHDPDGSIRAWAEGETLPTHGTSGGVELTHEVIERLADEAEAGYPTERLRPRTKGMSWGS